MCMTPGQRYALEPEVSQSREPGMAAHSGGSRTDQPRLEDVATEVFKLVNAAKIRAPHIRQRFFSITTRPSAVFSPAATTLYETTNPPRNR